MRASKVNRAAYSLGIAMLAVHVLGAAAAAQVTIDPVVISTSTVRDPVPGRDAQFVFRGESNVQLPVMNAGHDVVFRARSASQSDNNVGIAWGIYVQRPGDPLVVLADTTVDNAGTPGFPVPGRPATARFLDFKAPLLNDAGDVVFHATFNDPIGGTRTGIYATHVSGGPIVKIVDTFDTVPGAGAITFSTFIFAASGLQDITPAALNSGGAVAFWAQFDAGATGLFGSTVSGGSIVQLADRTITPTGVPFGVPQPFLEIRPTMALNDAGQVAFHGSIRLTSASGPIRNGVFRVPVAGGTVPVTVAFQFQTAPDAGTATFSNFSDEDIDESGRVLFSSTLSDGPTGLYSAATPGGPFTRLVDTRVGGLDVPGDIATAEFDVLQIAPISEAGRTGFWARIRNSGTANNQGIYRGEIGASAIGFVQDAAATAPGLPAPARLTAFADLGAAINESDNLAFAGTGVDNLGAGMRGLYFYDACGEQVVRIVDSTISATELGSAFSTLGTQTRKLSAYQGFYAVSGRFHALTEDNRVAFLAQFSNFDFGIYVATISSSGGGGQLLITCPADIALECPADTSPVLLGEAVATDACSGATIPTTFEDMTTPGCGTTGTVTREWTADDGAGNVVTCAQVIEVDDTLAPVLAGVPANTSAECDAVPAPAAVTANDACDAAPIVTLAESTTPGDCPDDYTLTRTWTATDVCGNSAGAGHTIAVADTTAPQVTCPADQTSLACNADTSTASTGEATATDNCGNVSLASSDAASAGCGDTVSITRTWTATDECGNSADCVQSIATVDNVPPAVTCPPDQLALACGSDTSPASTGTASAFDDCGDASVSHADSSTPGCGDTESIARTWSALDECGNPAECVQAIATVDNTPPVITVSTSPISVTDVNCSGDESVSLPTASAVDACGDATVTNDAPATFPAGQTTTVTYTAEDDCGNTSNQSLDVTVQHGATILVDAQLFIVGLGNHPGVTKQPLVNIEVCAYERGTGSCAQDSCGVLHPILFGCVADHCPPVACAFTDADGEATLHVPPGKYMVIAEDDGTSGILPDPLGHVVGTLNCSQTERALLRQIQVAIGKKLAAKITRLTGSELLIVEPVEVLWDGTEQLYPFVFESVGDWDVTVTVAPPDGFVADHDELTEDVNNETKSVQFTITEVGSDLVPTKTTFDVMHNGRKRVVRSQVGISLTADYARSRGFDVRELRAKGLIKEPQQAVVAVEVESAPIQEADAASRGE